MKTLALIQGDLSPAAGGFLMYEGVQKIHQDLALALREAYGGDALHPRWGSILQDMVGEPLTAEIKQQILVEINRVINNYITVQNARIVQDNVSNILSNITSDDVVNAISGISVQQIYDSIVVQVTLQTLSRQQVKINQTIG